MLKAIYAVATAAIIAAGIVALPGIFPQERQNTKLAASECQQNAWPYNQSPCPNGQQNSSATARAVRVIPAGRPNTHERYTK
jgi:hypothetical protein